MYGLPSNMWSILQKKISIDWQIKCFLDKDLMKSYPSWLAGMVNQQEDETYNREWWWLMCWRVQGGFPGIIGHAKKKNNNMKLDNQIANDGSNARCVWLIKYKL